MNRTLRANCAYIEPLGIPGGMGNYNDALVEQLAAFNNVSVVTSSASAHLREVSDVHVSSWWRGALDRDQPRFLRASQYCLGWMMVLPLLARSRGQVVVHFFHAPVVDLVFLFIVRWFLRLRVVWIAHDPVPVVQRRSSFFYRLCARTASRVVVHGPQARQDVAALGVSPTRVHLGCHGDFECPEVMPRDLAGRILFHDLDRSSTGPCGLIIGNIKPGKGIERLLGSLRELSSPVLDTLIVKGDSQGQTRTLVDTVSLPFRVVRIDRRFSAEVELAAFSYASVVFATYEWGYSSGVIARAHSVDTPVILTRVGDLSAQADRSDVVLAPDYGPADLGAALDATLSRGEGTRVSPRRLNGWGAQVSAILDCEPEGRP